MGQACSSAGHALLQAANNGDHAQAQAILARKPNAVLHRSIDGTGALHLAAAKGHLQLVQLILETAVQLGKHQHVLQRTNSKQQSPLMLACKHGHPECVSYLVSNGADVRQIEDRRMNSCLHLAALYGHNDCVHALLSARPGLSPQGRLVPIAQTECLEGSSNSAVRLIDLRNGWGVTALHIASYQGAVNTVRTLLRHGATLDIPVVAPSVQNSPIRSALGSTCLHIAAVSGNAQIVRLILEAQEAFADIELRSITDSTGMKPQHYAQRSRNLMLSHLLDERLPISLLRHVWSNYALDSSAPTRHQALASMLQKLKLMFNLELISAERHIALADAILATGCCDTTPATTPSMPGSPSLSPKNAQVDATSLPDAPLATSDEVEVTLSAPDVAAATQQPGEAADMVAPAPLSDGQSDGGALPAGADTAKAAEPAAGAKPKKIRTLTTHHVQKIRNKWQQRLDDVQALLLSVTSLSDMMDKLLAQPQPAPEANSTALPPPGNEAILDLILALLMTSRNISAVMHAAKKLVTASVLQAAAPGTNPSADALLLAADKAALESAKQALHGPSVSSEAQHSRQLLLTALKAVETCLHVASHLAASPVELQQAQLRMAFPMLQGPTAAPGTQPTTPTAAGNAAGADTGMSLPDATAAATADDAGAERQLGPHGFVPGSGMSTPRAAAGEQAAAFGTSPMTALLQPAGRAMPFPCANTLPALPSVVQIPPNRIRGPPVPPSTTATQTFLLDPVNGPFVIVHPSDQEHALEQANLSMAPDAESIGDGPGQHWSGHLHTLLAQLHWDVSIQRSRRRQRHAARTAAAAGNILGGVSQRTSRNGGRRSQPAPVAAPSPLDGTTNEVTDLTFMGSAVLPALAAVAAADDQQGVSTPGQDQSTELPEVTLQPNPGLHGMLYHVLSRRGDAPQDVLTVSGLSPATPEASLPENTHLASGAEASLPSGSGTAGMPAAAADGLLFVQPSATSSTTTGTARRSLDQSTNTQAGTAAAGRARLPSAIPPGLPRPAALPPVATASGVATVAAAKANKKVPDWKMAPDSDSDDSLSVESEQGVCAICMELPVSVVVTPCNHGLCVQCALQLTIKGKDAPCCPFCRARITSFDQRAAAPAGLAAPLRGNKPR